MRLGKKNTIAFAFALLLTIEIPLHGWAQSVQWLQQSQLTASDGTATDDLGWSVAVSGNTAVVAAPEKTVGSNSAQGAAYVFVNNNGTWVQQAELTASDGTAFDYFGSSVAVDGSTIVVGAGSHTIGSNQHQGAVYVFTQNGSSWTQQAELTASDGANNNYFGFSVAISGSVIVVGANGRPGTGLNVAEGAAYVFEASGGMWTQQAELIASDGTAYDQFGFSVAVSGGTVAIGAPCHATYGGTCPGAAYIFGQSGATWTQQAELTASDGADNDDFGWSVALEGSAALMGAPHHTSNQNYQGAVYIFTENAGTWSQQQELTASDAVANDTFGYSVAISGGAAVIGAIWHPYTAFCSCPGPGSAYVFTQSGGTWIQQTELTASDGVNNDFFGHSVSLSGITALAGALYHQVGSNQGQGAAYVFGSSAPSFTLTPSPTNLTVVQGSHGASAITVTTVNGFSGSVSLSASGLPAGVTSAFSQNAATGTSTLTLTASATATTGLAIVTVTGISGALTRTTTLILTVTSAATPDFTVGASPTSVTIGSPGRSGTTTLTITPSGGFNGTVNFTGASCSGLPTGASCSFNPQSLTANGGAVSTTLTFGTTTASAHTTRPMLARKGEILLALMIPGLLILGAGGNGRYRSGVGRPMLVVLLMGFLLVTFNACGGGSNSGGSGGGGGGGGGGGTPAGTYNITVTATGSGLSHSAIVTLNIQ